MPNIEVAVALAEKAVWEPTEDDNIRSYFIDENTQGKLWKDYMQHEGIVVHTENYDKDNGIGVSFKVKNYDYNERGLSKIHKDCIEYKKAKNYK